MAVIGPMGIFVFYWKLLTMLAGMDHINLIPMFPCKSNPRQKLLQS
jgi:pyoverdine/dityrosine biosynthesis protein Dit1